MMVTDLRHFLDLPADVPGPARRLAEHLGNIVRAATAGDIEASWQTALPCPRRPGNRRCPGRMVVVRTAAESPIRWQCSGCEDAGVISNWEDSPFDLRRGQLIVVDDLVEIVVSDEVAAALREIRLYDVDCERVVYRMRAHADGAALSVDADDLEELIGFVAAESNHEPHRQRQRRLDAAFDALNSALMSTGVG